MSQYFRCKHCHQFHPCNIRLKVKQKYCSSKACQQARKNLWEREKVCGDKVYSDKRKASKSAWRKQKPADRYQKAYREIHTGYENHNRDMQKQRKKVIATLAGNERLSKIVKTDTLKGVNIATWGLYEILPYAFVTGEKIVKTDSLIVEIRSYQSMQNKVALKTRSL